MYRRSTPQALATSVVNAVAVRTDAPYLARHMPWYLDGSNLSEEEANYFATANRSNSWKPSGKAMTSRFSH